MFNMDMPEAVEDIFIFFQKQFYFVIHFSKISESFIISRWA